jgi:hypothetical protein
MLHYSSSLSPEGKSIEALQEQLETGFLKPGVGG